MAYGTNLSEALLVISQMLKTNPRVLKEIEPVVGIASLGNSSIDIAVKPWVTWRIWALPARRFIARSSLKFNARRIEIPFRQIEVRLLNTLPSAADLTGVISFLFR